MKWLTMGYWAIHPSSVSPAVSLWDLSFLYGGSTVAVLLAWAYCYAQGPRACIPQWDRQWARSASILWAPPLLILSYGMFFVKREWHACSLMPYASFFESWSCVVIGQSPQLRLYRLFCLAISILFVLHFHVVFVIRLDTHGNQTRRKLQLPTMCVFLRLQLFPATLSPISSLFLELFELWILASVYIGSPTSRASSFFLYLP